MGAITGASFLVWLGPTDIQTTFVVSDYKSYLDGVKSIHEVLQESIELEYQSLREGAISPADYKMVTEVTSSQVTTQIGEFVTSKPPEEWQESYISYMEAMKKFNEYVGETKVLATMIESGSPADEIEKTAERIDALKAESLDLVRLSDDSRPG